MDSMLVFDRRAVRHHRDRPGEELECGGRVPAHGSQYLASGGRLRPGPNQGPRGPDRGEHPRETTPATTTLMGFVKISGSPGVH